jgi:hypothetical protein
MTATSGSSVRSDKRLAPHLYETWQLASSNLQDRSGPVSQPLGTTLLTAAGSMDINLLKFTLVGQDG